MEKLTADLFCNNPIVRADAASDGLKPQLAYIRTTGTWETDSLPWHGGPHVYTELEFGIKGSPSIFKGILRFYDDGSLDLYVDRPDRGGEYNYNTYGNSDELSDYEMYCEREHGRTARIFDMDACFVESNMCD